MKKIIAAVDFSEVSEAVIEQSIGLAQAFSAELTLIHVAAPDPEFVGYDAGPDTVRQQRARELTKEHQTLQETAERLRQQGVRAKALLVQGATVETILKEMERTKADAVVVGSHGHGALHRVLLGSVSEAILRASRCPVIVVPAPRKSE